MLMLRVPKRDKMIVLGISIGLGLFQAATILVNTMIFKAPLILDTDQLLFITVMVMLFPPAVVNFLDMRWRISVDRNIPEFLRELSEAGRTGVTLTRALDLASKRRYGPLSSELERVVAKISWGGNFEDALRDFGRRVDTKLAKRTTVLLSEISRSGGEIRDVLDIVSKHIRELQSIEEERMSQLRMYVAIVYVAFFIFLFIDYVLVQTFFAKIESLKESVKESGGLFLMTEMSLATIKTSMFHMSVVQGIFGGLVAGKMGEAAIGAGLKHSLIMIVIAFVVFTFLM